MVLSAVVAGSLAAAWFFRPRNEAPVAPSAAEAPRPATIPAAAPRAAEPPVADVAAGEADRAAPASVSGPAPRWDELHRQSADLFAFVESAVPAAMRTPSSSAPSGSRAP